MRRMNASQNVIICIFWKYLCFISIQFLCVWEISMQFLHFFSSWGAFSVSNLQTETHINCSKLPIFQTWWWMRRVLGILVWTLIGPHRGSLGHARQRWESRDWREGWGRGGRGEGCDTRSLSPVMSTGKLWKIITNALRVGTIVVTKGFIGFDKFDINIVRLIDHRLVRLGTVKYQMSLMC